MVCPITHFVGFPDAHGARYTSAVRVFGPPAFRHRYWDRRAQRDVANVDTVIFAEGDENQPLRKWNGDDQFYDPDPAARS
jgi:hypothetical protein